MIYQISPYSKSEREELINAFDSNVPAYFDPSERSSFLHFLKDTKNKYKNAKYYTVHFENKVIGAGGYAADNSENARIIWLLVHADQHGNGAGKFIMEFMHDKILTEKYNSVSLMTTPQVSVFYQKLGYNIIREEKNFWAKGMHLVEMEKQF